MHWKRWYKHGSPTAVLRARDGRCKHPLYRRYRGMIERCENPSHPRFADWGGRGITVCDRWRSNFWAFVEDMGPCPPGYLIDRIDNDGNYEPSNCRWLSAGASNLNQRAKSSGSEFKTHCVSGHPFDEANTRIKANGCRSCKTCARLQKRKVAA